MLPFNLSPVFQHPSWTDEPNLDETVSEDFPKLDRDSGFSESPWQLERGSIESSPVYELFYNSPDVFNSSSFSYGFSPDDTSSLVLNGQSPHYWALLLLVFPVLTAAGNGLVCASVFLERSLKTVTNYFIVSLAVADIMVAVLVMPLAVYVEVNSSYWSLGDTLCDTWVACDVMSCTASILNLTAISIDRFMAVTRPINYAKHKKSRRVYSMLALPWLVSLAISSPIALGLNYTDKRAETPNLCTFYNSDFLIYSSMASFYIPCLVMTGLYWRIYLAIRRRTRKASLRHQDNQTRTKGVAVRSPRSLFHPKSSYFVRDGTTEVSVSERAEHRGNDRLVRFGTLELSASFADVSPDPEVLDSSLQGVFAPDDPDQWLYQSPPENCSVPWTGASPTDKVDNSLQTTAHPVQENKGIMLRPETHPTFLLKYPSSQQSCENASVYVSSTEDELQVAAATMDECFQNGDQWTEPSGEARRLSSNLKVEQVARFHFSLRRRHQGPTSVKKNTRAAKRERKATKTLAVVLGVFLLCWMPFFTVNIINAICLRYDLTAQQENRFCQIDPWLLSFLVWLGYINSFLNPIIYTIFNAEFRRAFRKILRKVFNQFTCLRLK